MMRAFLETTVKRALVQRDLIWNLKVLTSLRLCRIER